MSQTLEPVEIAKRDLLSQVNNAVEYKSVLSRLDAKQLKEIQKYYWDFLIEESQSAKTKFSRGDILSRLEPTAKYQQRARCKEPEGYCTISMCVRINPKCAVTRISEIMLAIRPMISTLVGERPELLTIPEPIPEPQPEPLSSIESSPSLQDERPRRERVQESISDEVREKFQKYKESLSKMVENEGLEHAMLVSQGGTILVHASVKPQDLNKLSPVIADEIFAVTEQGESINFKPLLTVTKEYEGGVVAMRAVGGNLYLVGTSRIVLPAKIHSLIVKLGSDIAKEFSTITL